MRNSTFACLFLLAGCTGGAASDADVQDGGSKSADAVVDAGRDSDNDSLSDADETALGTDPQNPDTDRDGIRDGKEVSIGTNPLNPDTDGDSVPDGEELHLGTDPKTPDHTCVESHAQAVVVRKPVDIVFVIDNSGSMGGEIVAVQNNINTNFAKIIGESGLDYRIIMLSRHGKAYPDESICVSKPLSGHDCAPVAATPVNTGTFFHYSVEISSNNSFRQILNTFNKADEFNLAPTGWSAWLREGAVKVFVEITDDESDTSADTFEARLFALSPAHFGTAEKRNYVLHSIVGLAENNPATTAWKPSDPVQDGRCGAADESMAPGVVYQEISKRTGGLRFPICEHANFDVVFRAVAEGVVDRVGLPCAYAPPPPPAGETTDWQRSYVVYRPGNGGPEQKLNRVADANECAVNSYYVANEQVVLCPGTCEAVQADEAGKISVHLACEKGRID